jgi:UDP-glucose:(heptosyl)LPS alpha-1,3-glucosyltransferase
VLIDQKDSMRISLCFPSFHRRGGIERVALECANFLAGRGHDVHVIASDWDAGELHASIMCHRVPAWGRVRFLKMLSYAALSPRVVAQVEAETVGTFGVQCPPGGVLWVPSVHAAWLRISQRSRGFVGRLKQRLNPFHTVALWMEKRHFAGRRYARLLAHTADVRADLQTIYGVPAQDVDILPNGFAGDEFNIAARERYRAAMRRQYGFGDAERVIIFVANELERKGFVPLLRAVAKLGDPAIKVLAVGRLDASACREEIERLGLSGRVVFTGPSANVAPLYAAADLFALPTQYEAWGLVIIEAMACGLPVVTTRLAGATVAIREGESGQLITDPHDADEIAAALKPLLEGRHANAKAISESVEEYQWSRIFLKYEAALQAAALARHPAEAMRSAARVAASIF